MVPGSNTELYVIGNNITTISGFVIFTAAGTMLSNFRSITAYNNVETLGALANGSKGLIGLDAGGGGTLPGITAAPVCYFFNNTVPALRTAPTAYLDWTYEADRGIGYISTTVNPAPGSLKKYSPGLVAAPISQDITYDEATSTMTVPNVYIPGKLTVDGLIDPTGMIFTPQATNPGPGLATLYVDSTSSNALRYDLGGLRVAGPMTSTLAGPTTTANVVYYNTTNGLMTYGAAGGGGGFTAQTSRYFMNGTQNITT
jgi:hypothetical protein